jgi:hypothetical protein
MSIGKLILYPRDTESPPPQAETIIESLRSLGLIDRPMGSDTNRFLAGKRFLQLISFVGCSPDVCLAPRDNTATDFCHLSICGPFNPPQLIFSGNCRPPRCPACKKALTDWKEFAGKQEIKCNQCGERSRPEKISWGRHAGYGRIFIEIHNIFPGEAQPVDGLFKQLQQETGMSWDYFFTEANA